MPLLGPAPFRSRKTDQDRGAVAQRHVSRAPDETIGLDAANDRWNRSFVVTLAESPVM
jgi:hypothetical protein